MITPLMLLLSLTLSAHRPPRPERAPVATTYYADTDGDTYGDPNSTSTVEGPPPPGYVGNNIDCDDTNNTVHPGAPELINGVDDDCNGIVDDAPACSLTTTWNGSTWQPFQPVPEQAAIVDADLAITSNFAVCTLTINEGADMTVTGSDLSVSFGVIVQPGGSLSLDASSSLLQEPVVTENLNSGAVSIARNAPMWRQDYTYWGAPVVGQNLRGFSAATLVNRFYVLDEVTNQFDAVFQAGGVFEAPATYTFEPGRGYSIRAPNTYANPGPPENRPTFPGVFIGTPNNGSIALDVLPTALYSLISNPYPSVLDADDFLDANPGTLYFWTHYDQLPASNNYATYNGTGAASGTGVVPNGKIASGQGFIFDNANDAAQVIFTNGMRDGANGQQFFRSTPQRSRIWVNLSQSNATVSQLLLGYLADATVDIDGRYDGKLMAGGSSLSTMIGANRYVIQGRPVFSDVDVVPMGLHAEAAGSFTVSIDHVDGVFAGAQDILLKDNLLGVVVSLKQGSYTFASEAGDFDGRLRLQYVADLLSVPAFDDHSLVVYKDTDAVLTLDAGAFLMDTVRIFDIRGRLVYTQSNLNTAVTKLRDLKPAAQVLLVQITSNDGRVVTKKVAY